MVIRHCLNAILYCSCFLEKWRIFTCNYVCTVTVFMTSEVAKFYWALSIKIQYHFNIGLSWRDRSLMLQSKYILVIGTKLFLPLILTKNSCPTSQKVWMKFEMSFSFAAAEYHFPWSPRPTANTLPFPPPALQSWPQSPHHHHRPPHHLPQVCSLRNLLILTNSTNLFSTGYIPGIPGKKVYVRGGRLKKYQLFCLNPEGSWVGPGATTRAF